MGGQIEIECDCMMEEMKMTSREQLENAYCLFMGIIIATASDCRRESGYSDNKMDIAWRMWQASRAAIEVELPKPCVEGFFLLNIPVITKYEVIEAIESAGLKVKK